RSLPSELSHLVAERTTSLIRNSGQRVGDGGGGTGCIADRGGEERSRKVVLAGRQAHRYLAFGAPIELRRSARAGALATGQTAELRRQEPVGDEPVEMERGYGAGDAHGSRRLVLAD